MKSYFSDQDRDLRDWGCTADDHPVFPYLKKLFNHKILSITQETNNTYKICEENSGHFCIVLSKEEMILLAKEIILLVEQ